MSIQLGIAEKEIKNKTKINQKHAIYIYIAYTKTETKVANVHTVGSH